MKTNFVLELLPKEQIYHFGYNNFEYRQYGQVSYQKCTFLDKKDIAYKYHKSNWTDKTLCCINCAVIHNVHNNLEVIDISLLYYIFYAIFKCYYMLLHWYMLFIHILMLPYIFMMVALVLNLVVKPSK